MSTSRRKVIIRSDQNEIKDIPPLVLKKLTSVVPTIRVASIDFRNVAAEEKHLLHYQRRIEAVDKGTERLLDSIDFKDPGRDKINAKLKALQESNRERIDKIESDHKERNATIKAKLDNDLIEEQNKNSSNIYGENDKSDHKKIAALQAQIGAIDKDVGNIAPYQDVLEELRQTS